MIAVGSGDSIDSRRLIPKPSHFAAPAIAQQPPPPAPPGGREAMLMPGKRSLRQRVLTRPGATYRAQPGGGADGAQQPARQMRCRAWGAWRTGDGRRARRGMGQGTGAGRARHGPRWFSRFARPAGHQPMDCMAKRMQN